MTLSDPHVHERRHAAAAAPEADLLSPADRYEELFIDVQSAGLFDDCKTFVDCVPRIVPEAILAAYRSQRARPGFDLPAFVHEHFAPQPPIAKAYVSPAGESLARHIDGLWSVLTRHPQHHPARSSLLPLPHQYVVPGGRFIEQYYWDSYFTMLGLAESGQAGLVHAMTDNFAYLIDSHGFVPNGNRTYYLSRSQPPVFALMTELCEARRGPGARKYLPQMLREHAFWMDGAEHLRAGQAHRRVVALPDGALLNRYWDDRDTPREESWREDVTTARESQRPDREVYRHLRAAAESGWDFSSRWLRESSDDSPPSLSLSTICTTDIVPVDLNVFLYKLETSISRLSRTDGDVATAAEFEQRSRRRRAAIDRLLWRPDQGAYFDYDARLAAPRHALTAATVVPLFTGVASTQQALAVARTVCQRLLAPGGMATTEWVSGQQWDRPNGWAPLQWMAVQGFERYGMRAIADAVRSRWVKTVGDVYCREGKVVEKYALRETQGERTRGGHGGEYPLQDGFGWTNGVTRRWLHEIPDHDVCVGEPAPNDRRSRTATGEA
jgi:alpha,alpha-trehalase